MGAGLWPGAPPEPDGCGGASTAILGDLWSCAGPISSRFGWVAAGGGRSCGARAANGDSWWSVVAWRAELIKIQGGWRWVVRPIAPARAVDGVGAPWTAILGGLWSCAGQSPAGP